MTSSNNKTINPSSTTREGLFASTGLRRVCDQLLQGATIGRKLKGLKAFGVGAGVVVDVAGCGSARTVGCAVEVDDIGLRRGEEGGAADEDGCEYFHGGWGCCCCCWFEVGEIASGFYIRIWSLLRLEDDEEPSINVTIVDIYMCMLRLCGSCKDHEGSP